MDHLKEKLRKRTRRHLRIRKKVIGTAERPRLSVYRSLKHIYCQIINDIEGRLGKQPHPVLHNSIN